MGLGLEWLFWGVVGFVDFVGFRGEREVLFCRDLIAVFEDGYVAQIWIMLINAEPNVRSLNC